MRGCDLQKSTCEHLDDYLVWGTTRKFFEPTVQPKLSVLIEEYAFLESYNNTQGVWELFTRLRKLPLENEHIRLAIRYMGLKQSRRQIMRELNWGVPRFTRVLKETMDIVRSHW